MRGARRRDGQVDEEEEEEEEAVSGRKRKGVRERGGSASSEVPLCDRLDEQEVDTAEEASSTFGQSARKKLKLERKAARARHESGKSDADSKPKSKHAPAEMKSNRPVRRLREPGNNAAPKPQDPRFSDLHGKLKPQAFFSSYGFLDKYQEDEITKLSKAMKTAKSPSLREHLKGELGSRKQEMTERRRALKIRERLQAARDEERSKVAAGKKPFFLKDSAKKTLALEARYDELKQQGRGKLKKFIEKKRVKNVKKDARWLPEARHGDD